MYKSDKDEGLQIVYFHQDRTQIKGGGSKGEGENKFK